MPHIYLQNCPFPLDDLYLPSNAPIPRPTPLTIPNGIQIQSAILPQYTLQTDQQSNRRTDRLTDTWDWWRVCSKRRLRLIVSDVANKNYTSIVLILFYHYTF